MSNSLPSNITVTETRQRELDLSSIRYAVVSSTRNTVYALFRWEDRAKTFVRDYAQGCSIIDLKAYRHDE